MLLNLCATIKITRGHQGIGKIIFKVTHLIGGNNVLGLQFFRRSMKFLSRPFIMQKKRQVKWLKEVHQL